MPWFIFLLFACALSAALLLLHRRRVEWAQLAGRLEQRDQARESGTHRARLQYPQVDLDRCLGCGTCVSACPEEGVLELIHGQALVVHGARCVGHGRCADECPTGAIAVALSDVSERDDLPAMTESLESATVPGLFLAGELTGYALIRTAIGHGTAVADEVARRVGELGGSQNGVLDLCVVGAGPAGLACSLGARVNGLEFLTIEQADIGGTVSSYPRRKLVMTQPVDLPLYGRLKQSTYAKEELMDLWTGIVESLDLPIRTGVRFREVQRRADGLLEVLTDGESVVARHVCLALGRRGTPRKLGVPGEDAPHVAYSLLDAQSYEDRRVLVVGGGDSAVEAALGLAEQRGNRVHLSYRRGAFARIKPRNERRLAAAIEQGRLHAELETQVVAIHPQRVDLSGSGAREGQRLSLEIDDVFVMAGGEPPFEALRRSGVSFDPADRPPAADLGESGRGLRIALASALALCLLAALWTLNFDGYYQLPLVERPASRWHPLLRPSGAIGLSFGIAAVLAVLVNLAYLLRRSSRVPVRFGRLRTWMTVHVATGLSSLVLVLLHAALHPRPTVGGQALVAMLVIVVTGAVGRYFYAFVPRAANGRELELDEVRGNLAQLSGELDRVHRGFGDRVRDEVEQQIRAARRPTNFLGRLFALARARSGLARQLQRLRELAQEADLPGDQLEALAQLLRRAQRAALSAAYYEDLRLLMNSWRVLHRWGALFMVLVVLAHVVAATRFARLFG